MPKKPTGRTIGHERDLARRIEWERARRKMSYEVLADAMAEVGCPIQPSSLYKVERGDPPRKITVDEFMAMSRVFELPLEELIVPPDVMEDLVLRELLSRLAGASGSLLTVTNELHQIRKDIDAAFPKFTEELRLKFQGAAGGNLDVVNHGGQILLDLGAREF